MNGQNSIKIGLDDTAMPNDAKKEENKTMEKRTSNLKTASKVIAVITKISYIAMIVALGICAATLIYMAVTGGQTSVLTVGGVNIIAMDASLADKPAVLAATCAVLMVMCGLFLAIFLLAQRMFQEISQTGQPFTGKYVKTIRVIGILMAVMPIAVGIAGGIATAFAGTQLPQMHADLPGIIVGAIIFCLSYIIDYGCGLRE